MAGASSWGKRGGPGRAVGFPRLGGEGAAAAEGRQVLRQGDVFLVERRRGGDDLAALPERHRFDPESRTLTHPQHGSLPVPFPFAVHLTRTVPTGARVHNWD